MIIIRSPAISTFHGSAFLKISKPDQNHFKACTHGGERLKQGGYIVYQIKMGGVGIEYRHDSQIAHHLLLRASMMPC